MDENSGLKDRIRIVCDQAFQQVDLDSSKVFDLQQFKTGLYIVFQELSGALPLPHEYWYELVFQNYDRDRDGFINANDFHDIVLQYSEHFHAKQSKAKSQDILKSSGSKSRELSSSSNGFSVDVPDRSSFLSAPPSLTAFPPAMQHYGNSINKHRQLPEASVNSAIDDDSSGSSPNGVFDMPEISGRRLISDDYDFFDKAGQGSFGKVMVVRHKISKHVRACKSITLRGCQAQADFIRVETQMLRSLDHPNIIKLFETYNDGTNVYMISELCEGGSLLDRLSMHYPPGNQRNGPYRLMSEGLVALISQQLLAAVACCHAHHIIHRDIKPDNVLFVNRSRESPLKLIDFGLATTVENAKKSLREIKIKRKGLAGLIGKSVPSCLGGCGAQYKWRRVMTRAGTLHYFSPEMIRGEYTEQTDVFAVGIIMYQLLTGIHPFYTPGLDDEKSVRYKISRRNVEFPSQYWSLISTDAKDLTRRLLLRDPRERLTASAALKHRWFQDPLKPTLHGNNSGSVTHSIFEGLKEYKKLTTLKQALLRVLARELTEIQTSDLRRKFLTLDQSGDGRLSREEIASGLKNIGISPTEMDMLFPAASHDSITYSQFLAALSERKVKFSRNQLKEAFKKLDPGNTGFIQPETLSEIIMSHVGSDANISEVLAESAISPDGGFKGLSFERFCDILSVGYIAGVSSRPEPSGP